MSYAEQVKALVEDHVNRVEAVEDELTELEELAETFSTLIARTEQIKAEIHSYEERIGYLYGQRQELYEDYHNSVFEGDTARVLEIEGERDNIDEEIANLQDDIDKARASLREPDGEVVAEMLRRLSDIQMPTANNQWTSKRDYSQRDLKPAFLDEVRNLYEVKKSEVGQRKVAISQAQQWHMYVPVTA